ncbi:oxygen-independent coproporphyrinogen III oxidase [Flammeovirgaceae bacterium SG7u.111]|nr:oxygen-independent coproporphyrinogen III oxidase [Flammeovirgaceae bacterium SG7u.132]WPO35621.1 oxygen-independent coproporphyrinogen III oxidase [Flammeovirgaceae bacterium SG7u.111]
MNSELIQKYNVPGPRYTSYPTVPYWDAEAPTIEQWSEKVKATFDATNGGEGISIYIHLPFCERLCTYCACNKRITVNHGVEKPYIEAVLKEWQMYLAIFKETPRISEIHFGGGTPTFFSPENLKFLMDGIKATSEYVEGAAFSFEGHPGNTTKEHLQTLFEAGFTRLSLGIQDFDQAVQQIINRIQAYEEVEQVTKWAREIGYTSINFDLIFGLPKQNKNTIIDTIQKTNILKPERIAFYSYAHVPWVKSVGQRLFTEEDLPKGDEKRELYELGKKMFLDNGYVEIGMDHFTLKEDELFAAAEEKTLHRNFMGYTPSHTSLLLGLGVSSISDTWTAFGQNVKVVEQYQKIVNSGELPIFKGHLLNDEDLFLRKQILNIMCHFETEWDVASEYAAYMEEVRSRLREMEADGLLKSSLGRIEVTELGIPFIRNICMSLDARLWRSKPTTQLFSATV